MANEKRLVALDWDASVDLAGGNVQLARDLLQMLLEEAPTLLDKLELALKTQDQRNLRDEAHKLHGSTAYCGVPALHAVSVALEAAIKCDDIPSVRQAVGNAREAISELAADAIPYLTSQSP